MSSVVIDFVTDGDLPEMSSALYLSCSSRPTMKVVKRVHFKEDPPRHHSPTFRLKKKLAELQLKKYTTSRRLGRNEVCKPKLSCAAVRPLQNHGPCCRVQSVLRALRRVTVRCVRFKLNYMVLNAARACVPHSHALCLTFTWKEDRASARNR